MARELHRYPMKTIIPTFYCPSSSSSSSSSSPWLIASIRKLAGFLWKSACPVRFNRVWDKADALLLDFASFFWFFSLLLPSCCVLFCCPRLFWPEHPFQAIVDCLLLTEPVLLTGRPKIYSNHLLHPNSPSKRTCRQQLSSAKSSECNNSQIHSLVLQVR